MFNNPFDSFHDTVAKAKEEREQLDRLLTISTPGERRLVAVIALFLVILAAWLLFGSVARSLAVEGVLVEPDEGLLEGHPSVQALVWVESDLASSIEAGMPAVMEIGMADGTADAIAGEVAETSAVPMSEGLAGFESAAPVSVRRVVLTLDESIDPASLSGKKCRIVIELGRQSPAALFRMRRSLDAATRL